MKTILVPVDFSRSSKVAALYAAGFAAKIKARIILLSVINASSSPNTLTSWKNLEASMVKSAKQDGEALAKSIKKKGIDVSHQSILGYPVTDVINQFTGETKIDLIIMGSKGATGLKKTFVGSNAAAMIQNSRIPVIVVPENARFAQIKTVVYASDMKHLESEMNAVTRLTQGLNARTHILHVTKDKYSKLKRLELENELLQYPNVVLHISKSPDLVDAIEAFVKEEKADLVILFTHKLDFYEKLLGKSVTREFAFKNNVPLMTFNKTNI